MPTNDPEYMRSYQARRRQKAKGVGLEGETVTTTGPGADLLAESDIPAGPGETEEHAAIATRTGPSRKKAERRVVSETQTGPRRAAAENESVASSGPSDWAAAVQRMPDSVINQWLNRITTKKTAQ